MVVRAALVASVMVAPVGVHAQLDGGPPQPSPSAVLAPIAMASWTDASLQIDGLDSESAWRSAGLVSDFREWSPDPDGDPSQQTDFRVLYSEHDIYLFVRAYDSAPDSIMRALARRDTNTASDQIGVIIDAYNDRRTGFSFFVNPDGVRRDNAISGDGNEDPSWDGVWEVATQVDAEGWTAEFRIPLSQLRYAKQDDQVFGVGVRRRIERHAESVSWPLYSRTEAGLVSQLGQLRGLEQLGSPRRLGDHAVRRHQERHPAARQRVGLRARESGRGWW